MKKNNDKHSQNKAKRALRNKKRLSKKPQLSKFQRQEAAIRERLTFSYKGAI